MKNIFKRSVKISVTLIILIVLVLLSLVIFIWYSQAEEDKLLAILGSLGAGMLVAIIQFIIAWQEYQSTEKLKRLQVKEVLLNRDKRDYYENYVKPARKCINMMGVTGLRFMEHFANDEEGAPENSKVILNVLNKGVKVRILLPEPGFLFTDADRQKENMARSRYERIVAKYNNFEVKYFKHIPAHSIFNVDDETIIGPIFPELSSKYTPAMLLKNKSPLAEKYLNYFDDEWKKAQSI